MSIHSHLVHLIECFHIHLHTQISAQVFTHMLSHGLCSEHFIPLKILEDMEKVNADKSEILERYGRENGQRNLLPEEQLCSVFWRIIALGLLGLVLHFC